MPRLEREKSLIACPACLLVLPVRRDFECRLSRCPRRFVPAEFTPSGGIVTIEPAVICANDEEDARSMAEAHWRNDRIQKFTADGQCLATCGPLRQWRRPV
jgi:hypothetical protein